MHLTARPQESLDPDGRQCLHGRSCPQTWCNSGGAVNENGHRVILASLEVETDDTENTTMADDSMALLETLRKASADGDVDFLREGVRLLAQAIMEAEVTELTGSPKGERDPERRLTHRNGYRERRWDTRVGTIELDVPRVRDGGYFPSLLEPRRRAERALLAVVQEAYVSGVSHPAGRRPRPGPGDRGHQQERGEPDLRRPRRRGRGVPGPAAGRAAYPYLWLDATYLQGPRGRAGRVDGGPRRDRGRGRPGSAGCWASSWRRATTRGPPGPRFIRGLVERGLPASASSSATTTRAS